jgi:hypothetical protein
MQKIYVQTPCYKMQKFTNLVLFKVQISPVGAGITNSEISTAKLANSSYYKK